MKFQEATFAGGLPIDGYGAGFFRIGGTVYEHHVVVLPEAVTAWGGFTDTAPLTDLIGRLDVLFIGTGGETAYIPKDLRETLENAGLGVEPMASPIACRTYNVLLAEGRRIGAALLTV